MNIRMMHAKSQPLASCGRRFPSTRCSVAQTVHPSTSATSFEDYVMTLQQNILKQAEALEGNKHTFVQDRWERGAANAGFGITSVLEGGAVLEKAAANISIVRGTLTAERAKAMTGRGRSNIDPSGGQPYAAAAMSLVFHTRNPLVPTLRADVRLFEVEGDKWFGGGADLTPNYLFEEDAASFHTFWKDTCDRHDTSLYPEYKAWCDKYFWIPARKEHRGIGGIFFDDLPSSEPRFDAEAFVREVGDGILPSWIPIVERRQGQAFTEPQRQWQLLRRGRYIEFNLLYDRGIRFGLDGGRIESLMVSAPPLISWKYNVVPEEGTPEAEMMKVLKAPREWC